MRQLNGVGTPRGLQGRLTESSSGHRNDQAGVMVGGADLTRASLALGAAAAARFGLERVQFVETDLRQPGLRRGAFDVVYSSGVVHHTRDPRASFGKLVELAGPGGVIVLGVYNAIARIPTRLRRAVARVSGYRVVPFDPILRDRSHDPERREAWLRDQYRHAEEHRHTIAEGSAGSRSMASSICARIRARSSTTRPRIC